MKFFSNLKSKALALGGALLGVPAFAEGETASQIDLTEATNALDSWKNAITGFIGDATPVVVSILGAALVIVAVWIGWKVLKRGASKVG